MSTRDRATRQADRLVRWYPRAWRQRYGDEFTELLVADLAERPRAPARTLDVVRGGMHARLTYAGLAGDVVDPHDRLRSSLAALTCCAALFLAFGVGQWSQMTIGWQWAAPDPPAIAIAMKVMSGALALLVLLAVGAAAPIAWLAARALLTRDGRSLRLAILLTIAGAAVLIAGARHFAHGWPGTGGHPWPGKGLIPTQVASFAWASTLSISSYWAHPDKLSAFPAAEVAWMVIAPLAIACIAAGAATTIRRVRLSPRVLAFEARIARAATIAMLVFLGGALCRILEPDTGPRNLFATGIIDLVDVLVMIGALAAALAVARGARRAGVPIREG
jgi:hypothetical protein